MSWCRAMALHSTAQYKYTPVIIKSLFMSFSLKFLLRCFCYCYACSRRLSEFYFLNLLTPHNVSLSHSLFSPSSVLIHILLLIRKEHLISTLLFKINKNWQKKQSHSHLTQGKFNVNKHNDMHRLSESFIMLRSSIDLCVRACVCTDDVKRACGTLKTAISYKLNFVW